MKRSIITASCMLIPALALLLSCTNEEPVKPATERVSKTMSQGELINRGKYLVTAIGCNHCHTPKKMGPQGPVLDSALLLSGHHAGSMLPAIDKKALTPGSWVLFASDLTATVGPWGISYAANLTPDSVTGIGGWTEEVFAKTMRTGKHLGQEGGRPIMPPMPWESIGALTDEDLTALYTFLHALPAVKNLVPAYTAPDKAVIAK